MVPFQQIYDEFVKQKGDLFKVNEVAFDVSDKVELEKLDRFSKRITYPLLLVIGICSFLGSVYCFSTMEWLFAFGLLLCSIAFVALSFYYKGHYKELLADGKKNCDARDYLQNKEKRFISFWSNHQQSGRNFF